MEMYINIFMGQNWFLKLNDCYYTLLSTQIYIKFTDILNTNLI